MTGTSLNTAATVTPNFVQRILYCIRKVGGADRDRTGDLMLAKHALSQLSYSPKKLVGLGRVELPTSPLSGVRSSQLSYRPSFRPAPEISDAFD